MSWFTSALTTALVLKWLTDLITVIIYWVLYLHYLILMTTNWEDIILILSRWIMNKASGGDGIPAELLKILKDDAVKVLHSTWQQIWKTQQWPQDWKRSVFIPMPKKGNTKECSNCHTIAQAIVDTSKVMLKILQARLWQYVNWQFPYVQAGFRKGRGTRD